MARRTGQRRRRFAVAYHALSCFAVGSASRAQPAHPRCRRRPARPGYPDLHQYVFHQRAALAHHRRRASGLHLLTPRTQRRSDGVGCANGSQRSRRLHGRAIVSRPAAATDPHLACGQKQRQPREPSDHRAAGRRRARSDAAQGRAVFHAPSWPVPASLGAEYRESSARRSRTELHCHQRAPARLSTITRRPQLSASFCPTMRASMSLTPPGENATT